MSANTLKRFDPFHAMSATELETAGRHAREFDVPPQRWLLRPGRRLNGRYYLVDGTVRLYSPAHEIRAQSADARLPLYPGCEAMFTLSRVRLLHVDTVQIAFLLSTAQSKPAAQAPADWERRFMDSPLLKRLDPAAWQRLWSALDERRFEEGERLVVEGSAARDFFVLKSGHAAVRRRGRTVAHLGPGDFFGEDALLLNARRNATVTSTCEGAILRLPRGRFTTLLANNVVRFVKHADENLTIDVGRKGALAGLRDAISALDPKRRYQIVGGEVQERVLASFILAQKGFDAWPVE